jgi:glycosyltransferase involved in cell wall biosynthesis
VRGGGPAALEQSARQPRADRGSLRHICFFLANLGGGGAERMMANLASGLCARGVRVDVLLADASGPFLEDLDERVRVLDLGQRSFRTSIPGYVRYLRSERPQVVVTTLAYTSIGAALGHAVARVDAKLFIREASTPSQRSTRHPKDLAIALMTRAAYRYARGVIAVSEGVAADLHATLRLPLERIAVLANPVVTPDMATKAALDPGHRYFEDAAAPVVLAAGRLHPDKGFDVLLRAFATVRAHRAARLIILGEGAERPALESLVRRLELEPDVDLPGFVANPFAYMARSAVFVLSSSREGLPGVLIQAMATGCPVVATDCRSGPSEILDGGRYGPLVPVGDSDGLARAIERVLDEPPERETMHRASLRYSSDRVIEAYAAYFERALLTDAVLGAVRLP